MHKHKRLTVSIVIVAMVLMLSPVGTVQAASLPELSDGIASANTGSNIIDILLSLVAGKLFGSFLKTSNDSTGENGVKTGVPSLNKELIGFYAEWWGADTASYSSFQQNLQIIDTIAPFWATLNEDGTITNRGGDDHRSVVDFAHKNNKSVILLVNNAKEEINGSLPIHILLRSQDLRLKSIASIEAYLKKYNLDGVNIDFEMVPAEDQAYLTAFMRELSNHLKPLGYSVTIDVFPKQDELNDVAAAYDYSELAKYADKIVIMTYDNHGHWSGPGPVADIRWVENSLKYALQFIPKHKLYLGVAAYGYDWSGSKTETVEFKQLQAIRSQYNPLVRWDEPSKSFTFNYTDTSGQTHQVWFENSDSLKYKLDLVKKYDIAGAAMWRLGGEDPASWKIFREKLK